MTNHNFWKKVYLPHESKGPVHNGSGVHSNRQTWGQETARLHFYSPTGEQTGSGIKLWTPKAQNFSVHCRLLEPWERGQLQNPTEYQLFWFICQDIKHCCTKAGGGSTPSAFLDWPGHCHPRVHCWSCGSSRTIAELGAASEEWGHTWRGESRTPELEGALRTWVGKVLCKDLACLHQPSSLRLNPILPFEVPLLPELQMVAFHTVYDYTTLFYFILFF